MSNDKYRALVVKHGGTIFPKGWVSAVLPPGVDPSKYESSSDSLWDIVVCNDNPIKKFPKKNHGHSKIKIPDVSKVTIFKGNKFEDVERTKTIKDHKKKYNHKFKKHPHPKLEKGSLIWDYGPGRTYSTPQAAFDAMIAFWAGEEVTERQIVRGWSGTYSSENIVLQIHDLSTTPAPEGNLLIDVADGETVTFEADYSPIMGVLSSGEDEVPFVTIQGLNIRTNDLEGYGIAYQYPELPQGLPTELGFSWNIKDCDIRHNFPDDEEQYAVGFMSAGLLFGRVDRCKIIGFAFSIGSRDDIDNDWNGMLVTNASILDSPLVNIFMNPLSGGTVTFQIHFVYNSILKGIYNFYQEGAGGSYMGRVNCILIAAEYAIAIPDKWAVVQVDPMSNGNCYDCGLAIGADKSTEFGLEDIRAAFGGELQSIEADPLMNEDYTLDDDSPCWKAGVGIGYTDINEKIISRGLIDIGPYQDTVAIVFDPLTCGYCTVASVVEETGVEAKDLDKEEDIDRDQLICRWIGEMSNLIDQYTGNHWELEEVPDGLRSICSTMVSEMVSISIQRRKSPLVQIADYTVKMVQAEILTKDIKAKLDLYSIPSSRPSTGRIGLGTYTYNDREDFDE